MSAAAEAYVQEGPNVPASAGDPSYALVTGQPVARALPGLLATAAERGLARGARDLLNLGVDPDEPVHTLHGELPAFATALHVAAEEGKIGVVNLLLAAGAHLDARADGTGQTPLHRAVAAKQVEMVQRLLDAGADVTIRDEQFGATPAAWAKHLGVDEITGLFASRP